MIEAFTIALQQLFAPLNLLGVIGGTAVGIAVGAIPGLNSAVMIAMLLPFTYGLNPIFTLMSLVALYCGSIYGGSISAILIRTPGTPESCATVFDGYEFTRKGQPGKALGAAISASAIGGLVSTFAMILVSPPLAKIALWFGPTEYFALGVLGLSAIVGLGGGSYLKAIFTGLIGLLLATVGQDILTGFSRFTFGSAPLDAGVNFIPVIIGLFAVGELLARSADPPGKVALPLDKRIAAELPTMSELWAAKAIIIMGTVVGIIIGIIPGVGATVASFTAYGLASQFSKNRGKYGTGILEGVLAPESANNATTGGAMIPLLSLGIPGSSTTAVLLGVFSLQGLAPGPLLFVKSAPLVYGIFASMFVANVLLFVLGILAIRVFVRVLTIPYTILGPLIFLICIIGSYTATNHILGVWIMTVSGFAGYYFTKYRFPMAPLVLGLILGPIVEVNYRRAYDIYESLWPMLDRPITAFLLGLVVFFLVIFPLASMWWERRSGRAEALATK